MIRKAATAKWKQIPIYEMGHSNKVNGSSNASGNNDGINDSKTKTSREVYSE